MPFQRQGEKHHWIICKENIFHNPDAVSELFLFLFINILFVFYFCLWIVWVPYLFGVINPFLDIWFANSFFPFNWLPFCFVDDFLCRTKALQLNIIPLVYNWFCSLCFGVTSQKPLPIPISRGFYPMFYFRNFIVPSLIFLFNPFKVNYYATKLKGVCSLEEKLWQL